MLTRAQKEEQVADLKERFGRATGLFIADYRGLNVDQVNELRSTLRGDEENQCEYRVTKNSVLKRASAGTGCESIGELCQGPTAIAIAYDDPVSVAKVLVEFGKKNEAFELKGGVLEGTPLDSQGIATLATLPSLLEMRGRLAGLVLAPATKLARLLNEPAAQLARIVDARRASLGEGGEA